MTSSGDLLADRRYAYAEASLKEGDHAAAADLARQAIEIAPAFAPAWFLLGEAREAQYRAAGSVDEGVEAYREALKAFDMALLRDPDDVLGAGLRLAGLGIGDPMDAMSEGYVRRLFDEYAVRFDRHLTASLKYRAPEIVFDAVRRAASRQFRDFRFGNVLDLGCGTGLAGEIFRPICGKLVGIDLSPAMVAKARRKNLYDEVAAGELVAWLGAHSPASADLVLAADVFVYLGDLRPVLTEVARVLAEDGLFAFTLQSHEGRGVRLGEDMRYAHAEPHVRQIADEGGLRVLLSEDAVTREDRGQPVPGRVMVLTRRCPPSGHSKTPRDAIRCVKREDT